MTKKCSIFSVVEHSVLCSPELCLLTWKDTLGNFRIWFTKIWKSATPQKILTEFLKTRRNNHQGSSFTFPDFQGACEL